ncbi:response regulator transcription factor [Metabacillus sp. RGM 3146]|uniref:response regulator transcription factor n=1 Tax=Metabacillus sp. RGM 3146 TaxID=3401092 RepID=UPI003B9B8DE6
MCKLLIVEDEAAFREGITEMVAWNEYGIDLCGICEDGTEGLQSFQAFQPDILLTDIQMPGMSGIELLRKAKESGHDFEALLLSGYSDFSYAKEGIKLGAMDYLVKPCMPEEILESVLKAKERLEERKENTKVIDHLKESWTKHLSEVKQQRLSHWLEEGCGKDQMVKDIQELKLSFKNKPVQAGIIHMQGSFIGEEGRERTAALMSAVYEPEGVELFQFSDYFVWIANAGKLQEKKHMADLGKLQRYLEKTFGIKAVLGVGNLQPLELLYQSYSEALKCLDIAFFSEAKKGVYSFSSLVLKNTADTSASKAIQNEEEMMDAFGQRDAVLMMSELDSWLAIMKDSEHISKSEAIQRATSLLNEAFKLLMKNYSADVHQELLNWNDQLSKAETFSAMSHMLKEAFKQLIQTAEGQNSVHKTVRAALDIIHSSYKSNLTLDSLAKDVFVSTSYLSSLFKQEMGINFLDYLHTYRIGKAKQLLKKGLKIYSAARLSGYQDERHFSSTFKKWTGMTPSEFQKRG